MSYLNCCHFCLCSGLIPSSVSPVRFLAAYGLGPGLADGCSQLLCRVESCQLLVLNISLSVPGYGSAGLNPGLNSTKYNQPHGLHLVHLPPILCYSVGTKTDRKFSSGKVTIHHPTPPHAVIPFKVAKAAKIHV